MNYLIFCLINPYLRREEVGARREDRRRPEAVGRTGRGRRLNRARRLDSRGQSRAVTSPVGGSSLASGLGAVGGGSREEAAGGAGLSGRRAASGGWRRRAECGGGPDGGRRPEGVGGGRSRAVRSSRRRVAVGVIGGLRELRAEAEAEGRPG